MRERPITVPRGVATCLAGSRVSAAGEGELCQKSLFQARRKFPRLCCRLLEQTGGHLQLMCLVPWLAALVGNSSCVGCGRMCASRGFCSTSTQCKVAATAAPPPWPWPMHRRNCSKPNASWTPSPGCQEREVGGCHPDVSPKPYPTIPKLERGGVDCPDQASPNTPSTMQPHRNRDVHRHHQARAGTPQYLPELELSKL